MYVSIMGDSISTYEGFIPEGYALFYDAAAREKNDLESVRDTWWMQVLETIGGELLANNSYSGSQVTGEEFPCASGLERTGALANRIAPAAMPADAESTQVAAKQPADPDEPDVILVYIGVNDFGFSVPCDRAYASTPETPTFRDAYFTMLRRMQNAYPGARIVCATILTPRMVTDPAWSFDEKWKDVTPLSEFNARIRAVTAEAGVLLADLDARANGVLYDTFDGLHPNKQGHAQMAQLWIGELKRLGIAD